MWNQVADALLWLFKDGCFLKFFSEELRSDFFNGFLSLAGFMLAAKTFIVIHMKQEVYDKPEYERKFDDTKRQVGQEALKRYGPLERMSKALFWIVVSSVVAAVCQVTIGLVPWNIAGITCIGVVAFAVWKLIDGLILMKKNLDRWFEIIDEQEKQRESRGTADNNSIGRNG